MARNNKGRGGDHRAITYPGFLHLPDALTADPDFISLGGAGLRLLIDIGRQYNGRNNGDLCASLTVLKGRGWTSNSQLLKAKRELVKKNWIVETRAGGMGIGPSLYAITWQPVNECPGKNLDIGPTVLPLRKLGANSQPNSNRPHLIAVRSAPHGGAR